MINGHITHPDVLRALASSGHSGRVLITDGHFPISTGAALHVPRVFLNYAPGLLGVIDVLRPLVKAVPIESAVAAVHDDGRLPDIWPDYLDAMPSGIDLGKVPASKLGPVVSDPALSLIIATAELRTHACIILTLGLRREA